jgi:hypothetical protein
MSAIRNTKYVVSHGYAGTQLDFADEAAAIAYWRTQAEVISYVNRDKFQPASVHRVVTEIEEITPARKLTKAENDNLQSALVADRLAAIRMASE